jgi:hypothetical protein
MLLAHQENHQTLLGIFVIIQHRQYHFYRYDIEVKLGDCEQVVEYKFADTKQFRFFVPGYQQSYNLMFFSCNGMSVALSDAIVEKYHGIKPLWNDVLKMHDKVRYHGMIGGGDQIYADRVLFLQCLDEWRLAKKDRKLNYPFTEQIRSEVHNYLCNYYVEQFRTPIFAEAWATIPHNCIW